MERGKKVVEEQIREMVLEWRKPDGNKLRERETTLRRCLNS